MSADYIMVGGFLGAGKTTAMLRLAEHLTAGGRRVRLITNDQSHGLVDTSIVTARGYPVEEITGGCFCCRFTSLTDAADRLTRDARPDVFLAEPVGSCTDLKATVQYPLRRLYGDDYRVAPLSVLVDPQRAARVLGLEAGRSFQLEHDESGAEIGHVVGSGGGPGKRNDYFVRLQSAERIRPRKLEPEFLAGDFEHRGPDVARSRAPGHADALRRCGGNEVMVEKSARKRVGLDTAFTRVLEGEVRKPQRLPFSERDLRSIGVNHVRGQGASADRNAESARGEEDAAPRLRGVGLSHARRCLSRRAPAT